MGLGRWTITAATITAATVMVTMLLGACGTGFEAPPTRPAPSGPDATSSTVTEPTTAPTTEAWSPHVITPILDHPPTRTAARATGPLDVFDSPESSRPSRVLDPETLLGTPTVVLVLGGTEAWLQVLVPGRPNGQTGWVRTTDVIRFEVGRQIVVDLTSRVLRVLDGGATIFETPVGVGSPSSPTPSGVFFVTDAVRITDPSGPWGPYALGLSARSDTVTEFNGGDGIIGIHGTNRPGSIGQAQSLGCIRVPNDAIPRIAELVAVGSPVTITS